MRAAHSARARENEIVCASHATTSEVAKVVCDTRLMAKSDPTSEIGRSVAGRYEVLEVLGRGGMGAVSRVRGARADQLLALQRGLAGDPRKSERRKALLELEYYTLAQLAHPSIIDVYEYGVDEHGPFYTM